MAEEWKTLDWRTIEQGLAGCREDFRVEAEPHLVVLDDYFKLFSRFVDLMKTCTAPDSYESQLLEIAITIARRTIAATVLLQNGLFPEARMMLRNPLELVLILTELVFAPQSIAQWKATGLERPDSADHREWVFGKGRIVDRITKNVDGRYPERAQAIARYAESEWRAISNVVLHAHSKTQVGPVVNEGEIAILETKTGEQYLVDFHALGRFLLNTVSLLYEVPKFRDHIGLLLRTDPRAAVFMEQYRHIGMSAQTMTHIQARSKQELIEALGDCASMIDLSGIPEDAIVDGADVDFADPGNPSFSIRWRHPTR